MRFVDAETAQWVAVEQVLGKLAPPDGDEFVISACERVSRTWVVFWNSRRFIETKNISFALGGNGPVLVSDSFEVMQAGTALPVEHYVAEFEAELRA